MLDQEEEWYIQQVLKSIWSSSFFFQGVVDMSNSGKFTVFVYVDRACVGDGCSVTRFQGIVWAL